MTLRCLTNFVGEPTDAPLKVRRSPRFGYLRFLRLPKPHGPKNWSLIVFVQIMEFELDPQEAVRLLNEYAEAARGETYARRAMICADRNRPGVVHS